MEKTLLGGLCAMMCMAVNAQQVAYQYVFYELDAESKTATAVGLGEDPHRNVAIQEWVPYEGRRYDVTAVAAGAFRDEDGISKINLAAVKDVGEEAFSGCLRLNQVGAVDVVSAHGRRGASDARVSREV